MRSELDDKDSGIVSSNTQLSTTIPSSTLGLIAKNHATRDSTLPPLALQSQIQQLAITNKMCEIQGKESHSELSDCRFCNKCHSKCSRTRLNQNEKKLGFSNRRCSSHQSNARNLVEKHKNMSQQNLKCNKITQTSEIIQNTSSISPCLLSVGIKSGDIKWLAITLAPKDAWLSNCRHTNEECDSINKDLQTEFASVCDETEPTGDSLNTSKSTSNPWQTSLGQEQWTITFCLPKIQEIFLNFVLTNKEYFASQQVAENSMESQTCIWDSLDMYFTLKGALWSPDFVLIAQSTNPLCTNAIKEAWIKRLLRPPQNFILKNIEFFAPCLSKLVSAAVSESQRSIEDQPKSRSLVNGVLMGLSDKAATRVVKEEASESHPDWGRSHSEEAAMSQRGTPANGIFVSPPTSSGLVGLTPVDGEVLIDAKEPATIGQLSPVEASDNTTQIRRPVMPASTLLEGGKVVMPELQISDYQRSERDKKTESTLNSPSMDATKLEYKSHQQRIFPKLFCVDVNSSESDAPQSCAQSLAKLLFNKAKKEHNHQKTSPEKLPQCSLKPNAGSKNETNKSPEPSNTDIPSSTSLFMAQTAKIRSFEYSHHSSSICEEIIEILSKSNPSQDAKNHSRALTPAPDQIEDELKQTQLFKDEKAADYACRVNHCAFQRPLSKDLSVKNEDCTCTCSKCSNFVKCVSKCSCNCYPECEMHLQCCCLAQVRSQAKHSEMKHSHCPLPSHTLAKRSKRHVKRKSRKVFSSVEDTSSLIGNTLAEQSSKFVAYIPGFPATDGQTDTITKCPIYPPKWAKYNRLRSFSESKRSPKKYFSKGQKMAEAKNTSPSDTEAVTSKQVLDQQNIRHSIFTAYRQRSLRRVGSSTPQARCRKVEQESFSKTVEQYLEEAIQEEKNANNGLSGVIGEIFANPHLIIDDISDTNTISQVVQQDKEQSDQDTCSQTIVSQDTTVEDSILPQSELS